MELRHLRYFVAVGQTAKLHEGGNAAAPGAKLDAKKCGFAAIYNIDNLFAAIL